MKVRLKNHDYVNNVDAGTIFEALNERGGEFDCDFPYWHGWVKDRSGNRKFLSYSKEDLELVLRPEIVELYNKISNDTPQWYVRKDHDQILIRNVVSELKRFMREDFGSRAVDSQDLSIEIILNPPKSNHNSWISFDQNNKNTTLSLSSEESLYLRQLYYSIKGEIKPSSAESLEYLREILKQL